MINVSAAFVLNARHRQMLSLLYLFNVCIIISIEKKEKTLCGKPKKLNLFWLGFVFCSMVSWGEGAKKYSPNKNSTSSRLWGKSNH